MIYLLGAIAITLVFALIGILFREVLSEGLPKQAAFDIVIFFLLAGSQFFLIWILEIG